jgi:hypothetical protein
LLTGNVSRYSTQQKSAKTAAVAPRVQRQEISANVSDGRRNVAQKPSIVGDGSDINLLVVLNLCYFLE